MSARGDIQRTLVRYFELVADEPRARAVERADAMLAELDRPADRCPATAPRPSLHAIGVDHVVTICCFRLDQHEGLHFDPVRGDWADGDTEDRPYPVRNHLLRRLAKAPVDGGQVEDEKLLDAFAHELAEQQRAAYVADRWRDWTVSEVADLIDPAASQ